MIRALTVLARAFHGSGASCAREHVAELDALVARPACGAGPVVVYVNAATPSGIAQPAVGRFLGALAGAGFVAFAPELPHVKDGEVTPETIDALIAVATAAGPRVALLGASTGAGVTLLAAADPRLSARVTSVMAISPFASLRNVLRLATTGWYGSRPFAAEPLVERATVRSLVATAPDDPALRALLENRDRDRFDALYEALDRSTRTLIEELSPLTRMADVSAPVELACDPHDAFFPLEEAIALTRAGRDVRLTVTPALCHVRPRVRPGLLRLAAALDRTLWHAAEPDPAPVLRPSMAR